MLILFSSDATSFSSLGLGVLRDFYSNPTITEVLNAEYNLEFEYVAGGWLSEILVKGNIIKANGQLFRIWDIEQDLQKIKILAKHIFFDLTKNFLEDVAPTNLTANNAINWILNRTASQNPFTATGNCTNVASARYVRKNVIDAIYNEDNAILKKFGGEIELDNYNVYVHQKRGNNTGFSVLYGKNLSGIQMSLDLSTVATRIMPQGKDELLLDELYVDSPLISNYFAPFYQKIEFSDIGIDEDNNIDAATAKNLLRAAVQKLYTEGIDKPTMSIKIDFVELSKATEYKEYQNLETVHLGDTITAKIPKLNLNIETRVVKTVYDLSLGRIISIECGTVTPNIVTKQYQSSQEIANQLKKIDTDSILSQAQINATNLINHPFGGYIYISTDTGELYIMDSGDPTTAVQVWKWGLGGLGFSSNGLSGPYGIAITQDGRINADYITTGTLSASVIEGYSDLLIAVNEIVNLTKSVENTNYLYIESAMEGPLQELTIEGQINLLYPSLTLYPSDSLYLVDTYLIVDKSRSLTNNAVKIHLPFTQLNTDEVFKIKNGHCYLIHADESIETFDDIYINLFEGDNYIYLESFQQDINLTAKYVTQNKYTDTFATKAEMNSSINLANESIDIKLEKKTDKDNIIAQINMSTEKDNQGSYIGIQADKLSFEGAIIDMTADDIKIKGKNLDIDSSGVITLNDNSSKSELTGESQEAAYVVKSTYTDEYEGQINMLSFENKVLAGGRKNEYENNNEIAISTGYGHYFGGIQENLYRYPSTTWYTKSADYDFQNESGSYNAFIVGMSGISSTSIVNGTYSNLLNVGFDGNITCVKLTQTSLEKYKKNFKKLISEEAKEILNSTDIYKYNFKSDDDNEKKHIGFVIGDNFNYSKEITSKDNDGADIYSMVSVLWQVVKEQQKEIDELKEMIKNGL